MLVFVAWLMFSLNVILCFSTESNSLQEGFCSRTDSKQILRICTEDRMLDTTTAYIDTLKAPKLRNTFCECFLNSSIPNAFLIFNLYNCTHGSPLKFEIDGNILDKTSSSLKVRAQKNTELKFISQIDRKKEGACLAIYTENSYQRKNVKFNIDCKKVAATTTTTETMPISKLTSQVTEAMSFSLSIFKSHTLSTQKEMFTGQTKVSSENTTDNRSSGIIAPTVSGLSGLVFGLAIGFLGMYFCIRIRKTQMKDGSTGQTNLADNQVVTESPRNKNIGETRIIEQSTENLYNQIEYDVHAIGASTCSENKNLSDNVLNCNSDYDHCGNFPAHQQTKASTGDYSAIKSIVGQDKQTSHQDEEDCSTYDSTVKTTTKHFQENNLYHHLSPNDVIVNKPDDT